MVALNCGGCLRKKALARDICPRLQTTAAHHLSPVRQLSTELPDLNSELRTPLSPVPYAQRFKDFAEAVDPCVAGRTAIDADKLRADANGLVHEFEQLVASPH